MLLRQGFAALLTLPQLYFEHAEKYGPLLNLKVAQKKTAAGPVSMVGFGTTKDKVILLTRFRQAFLFINLIASSKSSSKI